MKDSSILLEARRITKYFPGIKALDSVDFSLKAGTVHALMGENGAGKSTLVKCFMGIKPFDEGEMELKGENVKFFHPKQAIDNGLSMIEQELSPIDEMTVAENIFLGRESIKSGFFLDYQALNKRAEKIIAMLNVEIDVTKKMRELSLANVQLVEIAKAISYNSDIIIMDEPTSAIGEQEVKKLFDVIRLLKQQGKGIIYVSHRMEEIFTITDEITILRDGKYIDTVNTRTTKREEVITKMIGRKLEEEYIKTNIPDTDVVLHVKGLHQKGVLEPIDLNVKRGEILGIFGLMGAGRSEFCDALFGVTKKTGGTIRYKGRDIIINKTKDAIDIGMAYITEDRKGSGLHLTASVKDNISLNYLKELTNKLFIDEKSEAKKVKEMIRKFNIKTSNMSQLVLNLSGGNQQKVVLGKWLIKEPDLLILDEPTRGIDVGAKGEIYRFMSEFASSGRSIILISSEIPEILGMSDRIVVFKDGQKKAEFSAKEADQNNLMNAASANREQEKVYAD